MTAEPTTTPEVTPADADELVATVRRAAAETLALVSDAVTGETSIDEVLAAIADRARTVGAAHGLPAGSWDQQRVEGAALVALYATSLTTGEAAAALAKRLHGLDGEHLAGHLARAAAFLRP
jgi:hypothetical protein